jgi:UDP-3-O-[3-hydroxymyristoyl] glucosamine N-acyltransferase
MTKLSLPFYQNIKESWNDEVDGRQMGTVDIDPSSWIAQHVFIGKDVVIGKNVRIYPGVRILSGSSIGDDCELFPGVTIYQNVKIGNAVRIHGNTTIGADGFGYNFRDGIHHKLWHMGGVIIGDNVEIGANSCVDGGTFSPTLIGAGSKFDNHVQVGHNCIIGSGVILCGHVAIGGSSELGDFTVFGGKSGMGHAMKLGKACQVGGGALVNRDWPDGSVLGGHPARPLKEWMKGLAYVRNQVSKN